MFNLDVITKDSDIGKKLLIGSLLALGGIGLLALLGWMLEIMRRVDEGDDFSLPDFDDIGAYLLDGLRSVAVAFIWALPLLLVIVLVTILAVFVPTFFADPDDAALLIIVLNFCVVGLVLISILPMLVLLIPAMGRLADSGSIREALSISKSVALFRANPGGFLIAGLLGALVNSALGSIGAILCLVGIYPAMVISYALQGQLFGAAYRDAKASLANADLQFSDEFPGPSRPE